MSLCTSVVRDGEQLAVRWGGFHVGCMIYATALDSGRGPFADNSPAGILGSQEAAAALEAGELNIRMNRGNWSALFMMSYPALSTTPLNDGSYTLKRGYTFTDTEDGEVFELKAGDVLSAYRS